MQPQAPPYSPAALDAFVALVGARAWGARMMDIERRMASGPRAGQVVRRRHAIELAIERLRSNLVRPPSLGELHAARLACEAVVLSRRLGPQGRGRLRERLRRALADDGTLAAPFHVLRTAALQASRGFDVAFAGLEDAAAHDLLIARDAHAAEIACDIVSAEEGRMVQRLAWSHLADRVDADLRTWLAANPGRYLLKMTLPGGLSTSTLAEMHDRIRRLLQRQSRSDHNPGAVLRLEPLRLTGGGPHESLTPSLRREFGPEVHLSVTATEAGVFVMAARAGRLDEVAIAVRRRLSEMTPTRLSGTRPGILAIFVDDLDRNEWCGLRDGLELEGEARRFLARHGAQPVIAVTCTSRFEMLCMAGAAEQGELRFRNSAHPAAGTAALAPAVLSAV